MGGLIGECYATMTGCNVSDLSIILNSTDLSEVAEDSSLQVNVDGIGGSNTSSTGNTANVTWNGQTLEAIIADVPMVDGEPARWITNGDFEISEGNIAPSNIEAVIEAYGSYVPQSSMMPGIVYITVY